MLEFSVCTGEPSLDTSFCGGRETRGMSCKVLLYFLFSFTFYSKPIHNTRLSPVILSLITSHWDLPPNTVALEVKFYQIDVGDYLSHSRIQI